MNRIIKRSIVKLIAKLGYEISELKDSYHNIAIELSKEDIDLIRFVHKNKFTMSSVPRLVATLKACKYVVEQNIGGDFVECGVWRGGNPILAKKIFERMGSNKNVYLFDTFEGMTAPTEFDKNASTQKTAFKKYADNKKDGYNKWCYASLEEVNKNFKQAKVDFSGVHFIKGDVCKTLEVSKTLPSNISVLRLDTDWYESTLAELQHLYPLLSVGGSLLIDDYGHWEGARKAVDEYFRSIRSAPLLYVTDYTGRMAVKASH